MKTPALPILAIHVILASCSPARGLPVLSGGTARIRPVEARDYRARVCVLWRQGWLEQARSEALLGLLLDDGSAEGHRQLGVVEARLGQEGAALAHLERSLELSPEQPDVARTVARSLLRRARLRLDPAVGLLQLEGALGDLKRAAELDPAMAGAACAEQRRAHAMKAQREKHPARWREVLDRGGDPFRGALSCPGPPRSWGEAAPPAARRGGCSLKNPGQFLDRIQRRYPLTGCLGAQLARRLEEHGCVGEALRVWLALAEEDPMDPRWPLMQARALMALGQPDRAELMLTQHLFLSADRPLALVVLARSLLAAGDRLQAARRAVEAISLARRLPPALDALAVLARGGFATEARQAARRIKAQSWTGTPSAQVALEVDRILPSGE